MIYCMNQLNKNDKVYKNQKIEDYVSNDTFIRQKIYELSYGKNKIVKENKKEDFTEVEKNNLETKTNEYIDFVNNSYSDYDKASKLDF